MQFNILWLMEMWQNNVLFVCRDVLLSKELNAGRIHVKKAALAVLL